MTDSWDIEDFLSSYRPPEKVVPITMRGDLLGELDEAEALLERLQEEAERESGGSLADSSEILECAQQIQDLQAEVRASTRDFRLVAMGERVWRDLIAKHPPQDEDKQQRLPWHADTFTPEAIALSAAEPKITTEQAEQLLDRLSAGQIQRLVAGVLAVNGGDDDIPKSAASSVLRRASRTRRTTSSREASQDLSSLDEL